MSEKTSIFADLLISSGLPQDKSDRSLEDRDSSIPKLAGNSYAMVADQGFQRFLAEQAAKMVKLITIKPKEPTDKKSWSPGAGNILRTIVNPLPSLAESEVHEHSVPKGSGNMNGTSKLAQKFSTLHSCEKVADQHLTIARLEAESERFATEGKPRNVFIPTKEPTKEALRNLTINKPKSMATIPTPESKGSLICGNCGQQGHIVVDCVGPLDDAGYINACALCNSGGHSIGEGHCPFPQWKRNRAYIFNTYVKMRDGKPPIRSPWYPWDIDSVRWKTTTRRPQSGMFAKNRQEAGQVQGLQERIQDPIWQLGEADGDNDAVLILFFQRFGDVTGFAEAEPAPRELLLSTGGRADEGPLNEQPKHLTNGKVPTRKARRRNRSRSPSYGRMRAYRDRSPIAHRENQAIQVGRRSRAQRGNNSYSRRDNYRPDNRRRNPSPRPPPRLPEYGRGENDQNNDNKRRVNSPCRASPYTDENRYVSMAQSDERSSGYYHDRLDNGNLPVYPYKQR